MTSPHTLSDLARMTGLKPRTLQFWTANDVIQCDPETAHGGPGVARRYTDGEALIAIVLSNVIRIPVQVGALREIGALIRGVLAFGNEEGLANPSQVYSDCLRKDDDISNREGSLFAAGVAPAKVKQSAQYRAIQDERQYNQRRLDWACITLALAGGEDNAVGDIGLRLDIDDVGRWRIQLDNAPSLDSGKHPSEPIPVWAIAIVVNLTRALTPLRVRNVAA